MMKTKRFFAALAVLIIACCILPVGSLAVTVADYRMAARLSDDAGLLTADEAETLESSLDEISERQQCDIAIVTVNSLSGKTPTEYADDYYDENGFGFGASRDGILFLICMNDRKWAVSTCGKAIDIFTDSVQKTITDSLVSDLSGGYYRYAFDSFATQCDDRITRYNSAGDEDYGDGETSGFSVIYVLIGLAAGLLSALIVTLVMKGQLKTVRPQGAADSYIIRDSLKVTGQNDIYLYSTVDRRERPKDDDNSSTHISSSGTTHGGSSGSF